MSDALVEPNVDDAPNRPLNFTRHCRVALVRRVRAQEQEQVQEHKTLATFARATSDLHRHHRSCRAHTL